METIQRLVSETPVEVLFVFIIGGGLGLIALILLFELGCLIWTLWMVTKIEAEKKARRDYETITRKRG